MTVGSTTPRQGLTAASGRCRQRGLSLVELMIAMGLGLLVVGSLIALFLNVSRTNTQMAKANSRIENGRFAMQLLQNDLALAGFWGSHVPQFDDLTVATVPADVPNTVPDPCLAYSADNWTAGYINNLLGIPVQAYEDVPSGCTALLANKKANWASFKTTDILVVRHAEPCLPGVGNCAADTPGRLYFQSSLCENELGGQPAQAGTASSITLAPGASATNQYYRGMILRTVGGTGSGQSRVILSYDGVGKVATISTGSSNWTTVPDSTTTYSIAHTLYTANFNLHARDCTTAAEKRRFVSHLYYVRNYASTQGDGIPTLVRTAFDLSGGTLAQQPAVPLIEGIEAFNVEFGLDTLSDSGAAVNYAASIVWADPTNKVSPTNRGDGVPDQFVRCTTVTPCTPAQLVNVVAIRLYLLARNREPTPGHVDDKVYTLGDVALGPYGDDYQRYVFSTSVRLNNVSGRRETP